jgi:hypothetical protein
MAMDGDDPVSLPKPPPPRPAARDAAIVAAMRRFDGEADEAPIRARRSSGAWVPKDRRAVGALATAAVIAIVSVPVAFTTLRDNPRPVAPRSPQAPVEAQPDQVASTVADAASDQGNEGGAAPAPVANEPPAAPSHRSLPALVAAPVRRATSVEEMAKAMQAPPAPAMAPPPPPPPPAAARSEQYSAEAGAQDMVVTGSRIPRPDLQKQGNVSVMAERSPEAANSAAPAAQYGQFLSRLQAAVRSGNKGAVVRLVDLPLRVNLAEGARTYRDRRSIERDFDRIFTSRVRQAILDQRADRLFTNYQGAMIGDGEVWFDQTCPNASCSPAGPVRIRSINP